MPGRQGGGKRIFDRAFDDVMRSTSAPGSASAAEGYVYLPSDDDYKGGRKTKQRYAYNENSRAAFIELSPANRMTVEQFRSYHFRQMDMSSL